MKRSRGVALLYTLMALTVLFLLAIALLDRFALDLRLAQHANDRLRAQAAADAALAEALYQLDEDSSWTAEVQEPLASGATLHVTFDGSQSELPFSTNNANGTEAATGEGGRVVPAGFVHVVGVGTCADVQARQEALVDMTSGNPKPVERW